MAINIIIVVVVLLICIILLDCIRTDSKNVKRIEKLRNEVDILNVDREIMTQRFKELINVLEEQGIIIDCCSGICSGYHRINNIDDKIDALEDYLNIKLLRKPAIGERIEYIVKDKKKKSKK